MHIFCEWDANLRLTFSISLRKCAKLCIFKKLLYLNVKNWRGVDPNALSWIDAWCSMSEHRK